MMYVITSGDPTSIGPEIICKALAQLPKNNLRNFAVIGTLELFEKTNALTKTNLKFHEILDFSDQSQLQENKINLIRPCIDDTPFTFGKPSKESGEYAFQAIISAFNLCQSGRAKLMITAPISKEYLQKAGHDFDGHTGLLANLCQIKKPYMMLYSEQWSALHVSAHVSLQNAITYCKTEHIYQTIKTGYEFYKYKLNRTPKIAVAGLNPHSSENSLFGNEEAVEIIPAIEKARQDQISVVGPISPDTIFMRANKGEFDLVIAQYHDQGHIAMKMVAFDKAINITLGLPITRISVDHGTAFEIAGLNKADESNLINVINFALHMQ